MNKRLWAVFAMPVVLSLILIASASLLNAQGATKGKVLLIAREGPTSDLDLMLDKEIGTMTRLLEQSGFKVVVASASGQPLTGKTKTLKPILKLSAVNISDYSGLIIPCLTMGNTELSPEFLPLIRESVAKGKPVAAVNGGVLVLAKAGVLNGKQYALVNENKEITNVIYKGSGVVHDGKIITSGVCPMIAKSTGLPDGTPALTKAFIAQIEKK